MALGGALSPGERRGPSSLMLGQGQLLSPLPPEVPRLAPRAWAATLAFLCCPLSIWREKRHEGWAAWQPTRQAAWWKRVHSRWRPEAPGTLGRQATPTSRLLYRQGPGPGTASVPPRHAQLLSTSAFYLPTRKQGYWAPV